MAAWKPGHRRPPAGQNGRFGKNVFMLASIDQLRFMATANDPNIKPYDDGQLDDGLTPDTYGKDIVLMLRSDQGRAVLPVALTSMTAEELNAFEEFMTTAIAAAKPIVTRRDEIAEEAAASGNDSYFRRHRQSPVVSHFPGKV